MHFNNYNFDVWKSFICLCGNLNRTVVYEIEQHILTPKYVISIKSNYKIMKLDLALVEILQVLIFFFSSSQFIIYFNYLHYASSSFFSDTLQQRQFFILWSV